MLRTQILQGTMANSVDFQTQIASIMEVLANAAVAEICKVVDDGYVVVQLEMSQSHKENEFLKRKIRLMELQIVRLRAERTRSQDGSLNSRFHGVRLLNRHNRDINVNGTVTEAILLAKGRIPCKKLGNSMLKDRLPVTLHPENSPEQPVTTRDKLQAVDLEEGEPDVLIIKEEGPEDTTCSNTQRGVETVAESDPRRPEGATVAGGPCPPAEASEDLPNQQPRSGLGVQEEKYTKDGDTETQCFKEERIEETVADSSALPGVNVEGAVHDEMITTMDTRTAPAEAKEELMEPPGGVLKSESESERVNQTLPRAGLEHAAARQPGRHGGSSEFAAYERAGRPGAVSERGSCDAARAEWPSCSNATVAASSSFQNPLLVAKRDQVRVEPSPGSSEAKRDDVIVIDPFSMDGDPAACSSWRDGAAERRHGCDRHEYGEGGTARLRNHSNAFHPPGRRESNADPDPDPAFFALDASRLTSFDEHFAGPFDNPAAADRFPWSHPSSQRQPLVQPNNNPAPETNRHVDALAAPHHHHHHPPATEVARPFSCALCGKRYTHVSQLKVHQRAHTGERPYSCTQCGKQFPQLCSLKRHQRVHTGEKPFRCAQCGKEFAHSSNLKVHQSVHTGERRFHCTQCGKNFSFLSNLIRHQAIHAGK